MTTITCYELGLRCGMAYFDDKKRNSKKVTELPDLRTKKIVEESRKSFRLSPSRFPRELYRTVIEKVTKNRKRGPFIATSGLKLDYYLNASTNFLDKRVSSDILKIMSYTLEKIVIPSVREDGVPLCIVGSEMAGGVMVSQLCCSEFASRTDCEFVYMRKKRKTSGTCQQLEGPQAITKRDGSSSRMHAIWIDDCLSSGGSSVEGLDILKRDYNIEIVGMLFLIDRHEDRKKVSETRLISNFTALRNVFVCSVYDMTDISRVIKSELK